MTRTVVLVRHAAPVVDPDMDPHDWDLSADGLAAASKLRPRLPTRATFASSDEPKAIGTLRAATDAEFVLDARFGEVRRPVEPISDDFRAVRRDWVAGVLDGRHEGWERPGEAAKRFAAALDAVDGGVVVVATHGMVLTAWLLSIGVVRGGEAAAAFWERLRLPELIEVEQV